MSLTFQKISKKFPAQCVGPNLFSVEKFNFVSFSGDRGPSGEEKLLFSSSLIIGGDHNKLTLALLNNF